MNNEKKNDKKQYISITAKRQTCLAGSSYILELLVLNLFVNVIFKL